MDWDITTLELPFKKMTGSRLHRTICGESLMALLLRYGNKRWMQSRPAKCQTICGPHPQT